MLWAHNNRKCYKYTAFYAVNFFMVMVYFMCTVIQSELVIVLFFSRTCDVVCMILYVGISIHYRLVTDRRTERRQLIPLSTVLLAVGNSIGQVVVVILCWAWLIVGWVTIWKYAICVMYLATVVNLVSYPLRMEISTGQGAVPVLFCWE